ncbi:MAG: Asp-tRNA(Asn)/Glu-tRNA(Gln) amidotransferase subunit GatC [Actinomycetota bacterium]|nr:Asp-tRNA(Asn)/Glu-tRNA(Gln) amidotransferase subunit GatC [Actinomycetota bacterium]MDA3013686.1 Asp-tRNA(Asn)/Glu-tRNA(Gln) amidotransferase subunit GatC [Actinomycetota bacterium]
MSNQFDIDNVSKLASIELEETEKNKLSQDLSIILEHVQAISNLEFDISVDEVFIHPLEKQLNLQEDVVEEFLTHEEALSNAPESKDGKFIVPPSME